MAQDWSLKGAGAANLVYAYTGTDERLRGHVLRVRKGSAHSASEVDIALWEGVLDHKPGDAAGRELAYVADVMAPLLGQQYVFPGIPCRLPDDLRAAMGPGGSSDDFPALLQPDHTALQAAALSAHGYVGVGPAVCLEVKPKWGLHPSEVPAGPNEVGADGDKEQQQEGDEPLRRRYPRFMLHMLHKHIKSGVPLSYYNPLDLFSGDPSRMNAAVTRLLEAPSNNLRVFKDGVQVYGGTGTADGGSDGIASAPPSPAAGGPNAATSIAATVGFGDIDRASGRWLAMRSLAAALKGFTPAATPATTEGGSGSGSGSGDSAKAGAGAGLSVLSDEDAEAEAVLGAVARLAAEALRREGVLQRLHAVQALDSEGPGGALSLYDKLVAAVKTGAWPSTAADIVPTASASWAAAPGPNPTCASTAPGSSSSGHSHPEGSCSSSHGHAHHSLAGAALEKLRNYLKSVTAKDCGVMITLQRAAPATALAAAAAGATATAGGTAAAPGTVPAAAVWPGAMPAAGSEAAATARAAKAAAAAAEVDAEAGGGDHQKGLLEPAAAAAREFAAASGSRPWVSLLPDPQDPDTVYLYKVAFVDLDIKAAGKLPKHLALERQLEETARSERGAKLLRELAALAGIE